MKLNKMFDGFNDLYGIETKELDHNLEGMFEIVGSEYDEMTEEIHSGNLLFLPNPHDFVKEGLDVIYAMAQQLRERGVDLDAGLAELHRSNMSKRLHGFDPKRHDRELQEAQKRYPKAKLEVTNHGFVMKCGETGKLIKPTTYSPAEVTDEMIGL